MIRILERREGLEFGGIYYTTQDGQMVAITHETSGNGIIIPVEELNKIEHEYVPTYETPM